MVDWAVEYVSFQRINSSAICDISEELAENVVLDLDKNGRIIGIEVLGASKNLGKELVAKILHTEKTAATA